MIRFPHSHSTYQMTPHNVHNRASTRRMVVTGILDIPPDVQLQLAQFAEASQKRQKRFRSPPAPSVALPNLYSLNTFE